jgi:hypothetical protein
MHSPEPIEIGDGQTFLIIVQGDRVLDYTWAMMPHVEFVKRTVEKLPEGAWVGTFHFARGFRSLASLDPHAPDAHLDHSPAA